LDDILQVPRSQPKISTIIIVEHEMGVIERITERCVVLNFGRKKLRKARTVRSPSTGKWQEAYLGVE